MASGWLRFGYAGGRPPATSEALAVDTHGDARYLTGNPWPSQPPFDEIGAYASRLPPEEMSRLRAHVARVAVDRTAQASPPSTLDAGVMRLAVAGDGGGWTLAWSPHAAPDALAELEATLRELITELRAHHPEATLRTALEGDTDGLVLRLGTEGAAPFPGWVRDVRLHEDAASARRVDATELFGITPVTLPALAVAMTPGDEAALRLDARPPAPGRMICALVSATWTATWPGQQEVQAEGWLLPAAIEGARRGEAVEPVAVDGG